VGVFGASLAVALTWIVVALVLIGCGFVCRRMLVWLFHSTDTRTVRPADVWIGLGALTAYLEAWSLFAPISGWSLLAPIAAAASAAVVAVRRLPKLINRPFPRNLPLKVAGLAGSLLWLANLALGQPRSWDSGLYHFGAIEYAAQFPAIPGIANLHERLGAADAHLLFVAFLGNGPWHDAGFHVANGLLVAMLLAYIVWRLSEGTVAPVTRGVLLLLVPATVAVVAIDPGGRLSSPSLDLPCYILAAAGMVCLCDTLETGQVSAAIGATAALGAAAATRPQFLPAMLFCVLAIAVSTDAGVHLRSLAVTGVLPLSLAVGAATRQSVLSGYPFLPMKLGGLPVDWRVPGSVVDSMNNWVRSWARAPHKSPDVVLANWDWFPGWVARTATDMDVVLPLGLGLLAAARLIAPRRDRRLLVMLLAPLLLTLALWFFAAPDPRFVYAPIWLVPITLLAWQRLDEGVIVISVGLAVAAVLIGGAWHPVTKLGDGPFHSMGPPIPAVRSVATTSGLPVTQPVRDDRCWRLLLCTPTASPALAKRGASIASGFNLRATASAMSGSLGR
jgi:hypothetical protein